MSSKGGRAIISRRRRKGRYRLAVRKNQHVKKVNWNA